MSKINKIFTVISIYTVFLFSIGIIGTYANSYLESINWFGDWECTDTIFTYGATHKHHVEGFMGFDYHYEGQKNIIWSAKHYWYSFGVTILWLVSLIRGFVTVGLIIDKKEKQS